MLQDLAAERLVLGGIFSHGQDVYLDTVDILTSDCFTDENNEIIYNAYKYLFNNKEFRRVDKSSLFAAINQLGFSHIFTNSDTVQHFRTIVNTNVNSDNVRTWAIKLQKLNIARLLQLKLKDATKGLNETTGDEEINDIISKAENPIFETVAELSRGSGESQLVSEGIDDYIEYLASNIVDSPGISTGYNLLDKAIGGGLRRKTVSIIGARSKQGKSFIGSNVCANISSNAVPVLLLDTEMDKEQQLSRIIPNIVYRMKKGIFVEIDELETGQFANYSDKLQIVKEAAQKLKEHNFYYQNISGASPDTILSIIRRWVHKNVGYDDNGRTKDCVVIYDYIKLMSDEEITKNVAEYQRIGFVMTSLHNLCVSLDIPILGFVQLNRDGCDKESVTAVSQSDRIIWLSSNFSIYKDKTPEEIAQDGINNGNKKIVPILTRFGGGLSPGDYINYNFIGKYGTLIELDTKYNIQHEHKNTTIANVESGKPVIDEESDI